jgi:AcrR family transcriptional regulator
VYGRGIVPRNPSVPSGSPPAADTSPRASRGRVDDGEPVRDRIVRIATELFARDGYHATGVQALSESTGLGRGALYYHIKSKEDLLYDISLSLVNEMLDQALAVAALDVAPEEKVHRLARDLLRNLSEHRTGWTVSLYESRALSPERRREVLAARDRYERVWAGVLEQGAEVASWREPTPVLLRGVLGLLNSTYLWIESDGPMPPEEVADQYVELILDGLRPRSRRPAAARRPKSPPKNSD